MEDTSQKLDEKNPNNNLNQKSEEVLEPEKKTKNNTKAEKNTQIASNEVIEKESEELGEEIKPQKDDQDTEEKPKKSRFGLDKTSKQTGDRGWYIIHTYAGYEEQVAESMKQRIDTLNMNDKIFDVIVPKEKQIEIKNGKRKIVEKRIFPGYVIVDMIVTDYSWYIVRNTPNVTGFIGLGVRPTPMDQEEIDRIKKRMGVEEPKYKVNLREDDLVRINDGPLKGFEGKVTEVDEDKGVIKVSVSMFGRETPVNLDFLQVKKV